MILIILATGTGLLFPAYNAWAQPRPLKVSVVVIPPYSTRISDYVNTPNKLIVT